MLKAILEQTIVSMLLLIIQIEVDFKTIKHLWIPQLSLHELFKLPIWFENGKFLKHIFSLKNLQMSFPQRNMIKIY